VPEELRAPAREDSMSPGALGICAMLAVMALGTFGLWFVGRR